MPTRFVTTTTLPLIVLAATTGLSGCRGPHACGGSDCADVCDRSPPQVSCQCDSGASGAIYGTPHVTPDGWMRIEPTPAPAGPDDQPAPQVPKQLAPPPPTPGNESDAPAEAEMTRIRSRYPSFGTTSHPMMQPVSRSRMLPPAVPHPNTGRPVLSQPLPRTAMNDRRAVALQMPELSANDQARSADPFDDPFFGGGHSIPPAIAAAPPGPRHAEAPMLMPAPALQTAPADESMPLTPVPENVSGPALFGE